VAGTIADRASGSLGISQAFREDQDEENYDDDTETTARPIAQLRLCGHAGNTPNSIKTKMMRRMVPTATSFLT
jgi:hypothetical protein